MNFADLIPANILTTALGDDMIYHAVTGPVAIKAMFSPSLQPAYSGEAHLYAKHKQLDVAKSDVAGLVKGSTFTVNDTLYTVADIIGDDGQFLTVVLI